MPAGRCVISDSSSAEARTPSLPPSLLLSVSVNRTSQDLAANGNKRKWLQGRKLNIPTDAFDWE